MEMKNEVDVKGPEQPAEKEAPKSVVVAERLTKLGFKKAGANVLEKALLKRKMALAYELYRFVRQEKIDLFNENLKAKSYNLGRYQMLDFMAIESYEGAPPADVLDALEKAQNLIAGDCKVFDNFEVAYIRNVHDPIIFGRIKGCSDRFYIVQWDDDIKIEQILRDNEG